MKKGYSQVTTGHYVKQSSYLMDYLAAHGMEDLSAVTLENIYAYIRTLAGFTYKTVEQHLCSLRAFSVSFIRKVLSLLILLPKCQW